MTIFVCQISEGRFHKTFIDLYDYFKDSNNLILNRPINSNSVLRKGLKRHPFFEMAIAPAKKDTAESPTRAVGKASARVTP